MNARFKALSVHLLTATGAILSMLAILEGVEGNWSRMFLWLVLALIVDGIDGPLARRYDVLANWPTYDGVLMDLIIDYMTYVFIPAYALFKSGLLPGWPGWFAITVIVYGSVIYFAHTGMKTKDNSFAGFPACWNMVVLVLFLLEPPHLVTLLIIIALTITMFTNLKFIHPVRTERWRKLSLPMALAWICFAGSAALSNFDLQSWAHWGLVLTSIYLALAGIAQQLVPERNAIGDVSHAL
jgi:phosphatidylcholine synthase